MTTLRIFMNAKDIEAIKGCSNRSAHRLVKKIREELNIKPGKGITAYQFAQYFDIDENTVVNALNPKNRIIN